MEYNNIGQIHVPQNVFLVRNVSVVNSYIQNALLFFFARFGLNTDTLAGKQ